MSDDYQNHELLKDSSEPAVEPNVAEKQPERDERGRFASRDAESPELANEAEAEAEEEIVEATEDSDESADEADKSEPDEQESNEAKQSRKRTAEGRIAQLTAQRREAEARALRAEQEAAELREYLQQQVDPDLEFNDPQKFTQESVRRALADMRLHEANLTRQQAAEEQLNANRQAFMERLETMRDELPDFDQVFTPQTPVSDYGVKFLAESDIGPKIAHHLGKNPSLASRIANLPPADQGAEFARLEYQLRTPPPKRTSKAPKPIKPVAAAGSQGVFDPGRSGVDDFKRMIYGKG